MKKLLLLSLLTGFLFVSCKKETPPDPNVPIKTPEETYSERLNGTWNIVSLTYTASITIPPLGSIPINGTSANAGTIEFMHASKTAQYDIKFLPNLPPIPGLVIDTINLNGNGTYSNTTANITLTEGNGQILVFNVIANEPNLQLLNTQLNYQLDSVTAVPVTMQLRLGR
jgi:hypothetical protein